MQKIAIKIGGSVLTDKKNNNPTVYLDLLRQIGAILSAYKAENEVEILVGHGAGSFGHQKAYKFLQEVEGLEELEIQKRLLAIRGEVQELHKVVKGEWVDGWKEPIIHGDVDLGGPPYIISTERQILRYAEKQNCFFDKIILLTDKDGVLDEKGQMIARLNLKDRQMQVRFFETYDATGGMKDKVETAKQLLRYSQKIFILNGNYPERLLKVLSDQEALGTLMVDG